MYYSKNKTQYPVSRSSTCSASGFTVLEMIIVVGIIGVLIAMVLIGFGEARQRARDNIRVASMQNVMLALEQFRSICRHYPATLDLTALQHCDATDPQPMVLGDVIRELPALPDGADYLYAAFKSPSSLPPRDKKCIHYHIGVVLEDENSDAFRENGNAAAEPASALCSGSDPDFSGYDSDLVYNIYK